MKQLQNLGLGNETKLCQELVFKLSILIFISAVCFSMAQGQVGTSYQTVSVYIDGNTSSVPVILPTLDEYGDNPTYNGPYNGPYHGTLTGSAPNLTYTRHRNDYQSNDYFTFSISSDNNNPFGDWNELTVNIKFINWYYAPMGMEMATGNSNLALYRPTYSDSDAMSYSTYLAVDGSAESKWSTEDAYDKPSPSNPHLIMVDLQALKVLDGITINLGPTPEQPDSVTPYIVETFPADGAMGVSPVITARLVFSQKMDHASLQDTTLELMNLSQMWDWNNSTLTFDLQTQLQDNPDLLNL